MTGWTRNAWSLCTLYSWLPLHHLQRPHLDLVLRLQAQQDVQAVLGRRLAFLHQINLVSLELGQDVAQEIQSRFIHSLQSFEDVGSLRIPL